MNIQRRARYETMRIAKPSPGLALFFLAPVVGELLSGSAPPVEFFNPIGFVMLLLLYGSGAVIVRELSVRWKKGVGTVLLLGAAYGILEEGLMVCSFFNPAWPDLGQFAVYGRWFEVNWVWAVMLTMYHAVYSITVPILLVNLAYPARRLDSWIDSRLLNALFVILSIDVVVGLILFNSTLEYWPPPLQYLFAILAMLLLGYSAYRLPKEWGSKGRKHLPRPALMWAVGTVATFAFFIGFWSMPALILWWSLGALLGPVLILLFSKVLVSYDWSEPCEKHRFALLSGALTFFIVFAPLQELDKTRTDNPVGMGLVGLAFLVGLVLLGIRVWASSDMP